MRQALLLAIVLAAVFALPRLLAPNDSAPPLRPGHGTTSIYAADGTFVGGVPPRIKKRNLILILLDTVRRDLATSPDEPGGQMRNFTRLSRRGVTFRQASSPCSWTLPVITSVLTGLLPHEHGVRDEIPSPTMPPQLTTYAEVLWRNFDFQTAAFSDVPFYRRKRNSVLQGFEAGSEGQGHMLRGPRPLDSGFWLHGGEKVIERWVDAREATRPFFLLLHTYDAHDAYGRENHMPEILPFIRSPALMAEAARDWEPLGDLSAARLTELFLTSEPARVAINKRGGARVAQRVNEYRLRGWKENPDHGLAKRLRDKYVGGVRWTDEGLGKFVSHLEESGLLDNTLLVIFSDHGEAFGEHGIIGHGRRLDDELVRVPMLMIGPPDVFVPGRVIDAGVGVIDILPTFLDWIGAPNIDHTRGRSLLPVIRGDSDGHPVLAEVVSRNGETRTPQQLSRHCVRTTKWKYQLDIDESRGTLREFLFDLETDPGERRNLVTGTFVDGSQEFPSDFVEEVENVRDLVWGLVDKKNPDNYVAPLYFQANGATFEEERPPRLRSRR